MKFLNWPWQNVTEDDLSEIQMFYACVDVSAAVMIMIYLSKFMVLDPSHMKWVPCSEKSATPIWGMCGCHGFEAICHPLAVRVYAHQKENIQATIQVPWSYKVIF